MAAVSFWRNEMEEDGYVTALSTEDDFDLDMIFDCGQCFRWNAGPDGSWTGVAMGHPARAWREGNSVYIKSDAKNLKPLWEDYFDMGRDYAAARESVCVDGYMTAAAGAGRGIRILNQDRWETLCSFIISQCNNIPRIKTIIETLCGNFGEKRRLEGEDYYTFPDAGTVASLTEEDLAIIRCGYRAPYILGAARAVSAGELDLDALARGDEETARRALTRLKGVGEKVANCVILFSLRIPGAFPRDVWINRALREHYPDGIDTTVFGDNAGLAQQYMYVYRRREGLSNRRKNAGNTGPKTGG